MKTSGLWPLSNKLDEDKSSVATEQQARWKTSGLWPLLGTLSNKLDENKWSVATAGSTEQQVKSSKSSA